MKGAMKLEIIKPGNLEYKDTAFMGTCSICECVFKCNIGIAHGAKRSVFYRNVDNLDCLEVDLKGTLHCLCPECGKANVTLKEIK